MSDEPQLPDPEPDKQPGYQFDVVNTRKVWMIAGTLALVVLLCFGVIAWIVFGLEAEHAAFQPPMSALERERLLPPEPRLEATPQVDGLRYREQAEQQADSYGWVDQQQGIVHIPVKQAQNIILQKGWPAPSASAKPDEHHER
jgi:hypothetical protein